MDLTKVILAVVHAMTAPAILFMVIVAPAWIAMHYKARGRETAKLSTDEQAALEALTRAAERMENRIAALEKILDAEAPHWKERWKDRTP